MSALVESASDVAKKHPDRFLAEQVFRDLFVDDFKFARGKSGKLGENMISQWVSIPAQTKPGGLKPVDGVKMLAIHLNCIVKASALLNNTITINAKQFHITARSLATQMTIDAHGASELTADNSIHLNINTQWERPNNLTDLAKEVGVKDGPTLGTELWNKQGYNKSYTQSLLKKFREKVQERIRQILGRKDVVVKWEGDKTFPTE